MRVDCGSERYEGLLLLSLCMIVGFVFGLPCYWLVNLMRYREEIQREGGPPHVYNRHCRPLQCSAVQHSPRIGPLTALPGFQERACM